MISYIKPDKRLQVEHLLVKETIPLRKINIDTNLQTVTISATLHKTIPG